MRRSWPVARSAPMRWAGTTCMSFPGLQPRARSPRTGSTSCGTSTLTAAAAAGDHADIELLAESTRLAGGAFRHRAILHPTVGAPAPAPRISVHATALYSDGLPPLFWIEAGADAFYRVEVSDRSDFTQV